MNDRGWPELPVAAWADTYATLHMWMQIVGKIRLALAPREHHWWHVVFYVTSRGFTTSPIPYGAETFEIAFDFVDHQLLIAKSDGTSRTIPLAPQTVADFYERVLTTLRELGIEVRIWPMPVEIPAPVRFDQDRQHASYDPEYANRWWRAVSSIDAVLKEFRGRFLGKSSPVHFWWGSLDLAVTRFNGRRAPAREGIDAITREAYSHEVISAGFWPGAGLGEPAFYAYAAPEPVGLKTATVRPAAAFYSTELNEFILKYDDVRLAGSPAASRMMLLEFLESTYEAAATLGGWNRTELEETTRG